MSTDRPFSLADAIRFGAFGGIAAVLIALVGMIEAFSKRMIIADVISMAQVMLLAVAFVSALFAANKAQSTNRGITVASGVLAGAVTALFVAVLALLIEPLHLREVFVNATPQLVIPHPRMTGRRFVLQPLAEINPRFVLPGGSRTVAELLAGLPPEPAVTLVARDW